MHPGDLGWFANSDGSGVEAVLKEPEGNQPGEYLLAEGDGPGAIVRMWTADINGTIRVYLDGAETPVYDGPSQAFIRRPYDSYLDGSGLGPEDLDGVLYQRDASYAPIPFGKRCRIVWIGFEKDVHFYHIQFHVYTPGTEVTTFRPTDVAANAERIRRVGAAMKFADVNDASGSATESIDVTLDPGQRKSAPRLTGNGAITRLTLKLEAEDRDLALRQTILRIQFDGHPWGQVEAPVGDFFGAGPGLVPYQSLPFTVAPDGTMTCRFPMPYSDSARFTFENFGDQTTRVTGSVSVQPDAWDDDESLHFRARWRMDHGLTGVNRPDQGTQDIPFVIAQGTGLYVGTAVMLLNPSSVPTSWGNWWGEGDEKVFIDDDTFPSLFGTGTEDYFNYSWSAFDLFEYPYFAQPRDDGPANRGFVVNQRWHVLDPIPFAQHLAFFIELAVHTPTEGISYGRISYLYAKPGMMDDHVPITRDDVREIALPPTWEPEALLGARGRAFFPCEDLMEDTSAVTFETGGLWQGGRIMVWTPERAGEKLTLSFPVPSDGEHPVLITCMLKPGAGAFRAAVNGAAVKMSGRDEIDLNSSYHVMSREYGGMMPELKSGMNMLTLTATTAGKPIGLDFLSTRAE